MTVLYYGGIVMSLFKMLGITVCMCTVLFFAGAATAEEEAGGEKSPEAAAETAKSAAPSLKMQIKEQKNKDGIEGIAVRFFVKGQVQDVWNWIKGVENLGKLFPAVKKVTKVKDKGDNTIIWEYQLDSTLGTKILNVERKVDETKRSVKWKRVDGDMKYYAGSWQLRQSMKYSGWVECRYSNFIDAGALIPYFLVKKSSKKNAEAMAPKLRKLVSEGK